jgi:hypothetical protein
MLDAEETGHQQNPWNGRWPAGRAGGAEYLVALKVRIANSRMLSIFPRCWKRKFKNERALTG